eukprot:2517664-Amphidinium_carterae.1
MGPQIAEQLGIYTHSSCFTTHLQIHLIWGVLELRSAKTALHITLVHLDKHYKSLRLKAFWANRSPKWRLRGLAINL